jgi:hypothetical protein
VIDGEHAITGVAMQTPRVLVGRLVFGFNSVDPAADLTYL